MNEKNTPENIDDYISKFPEEIQKQLSSIRRIIRDAAPDAEETISYQMPTFRLNGNLVHFAAFKNHIGFYPTPSGIESFRKNLINSKTQRVRFSFPLINHCH